MQDLRQEQQECIATAAAAAAADSHGTCYRTDCGHLCGLQPGRVCVLLRPRPRRRTPALGRPVQGPALSAPPKLSAGRRGGDFERDILPGHMRSVHSGNVRLWVQLQLRREVLLARAGLQRVSGRGESDGHYTATPR